jgi:hypothetical protein
MVFWFQFGDVSPNLICYIWNIYYKITNAIFHAYRIRWFLEQFWVIMSTGMGYLSKYRIQTISNSTEIGIASPIITQQNLIFPLSNLRSTLSALCSTLTYSSSPPPGQSSLPRIHSIEWILGGESSLPRIHSIEWILQGRAASVLYVSIEWSRT